MQIHHSNPRSGKTQLIVLSAILGVAMIAAAWYWMRPATQPSMEAGRAVAETFLDNIRKGQTPQAWDSTTADFKSDQGKESFERAIKKLPQFKQPWNFVSMQTVTLQDHPRNEYVYRNDDGKSVRVLIGRDSG